MIDFAKIIVRAGNGGSGSGSFTHIKGKRYGKADGGNAGRGGSVYFEATNDLNGLDTFRFVKEYSAKDGENGLSNHRKGADGLDLVVKVPVGTVVSGETVIADKLPSEFSRRKIGADYGYSGSSNALRVSFDLAKEGDKVLIARGGFGGRGNSYLRDEYGRRPLSGESGGVGEEVNLTLELKLIADIGLIGLPNAGKSTLISVLTAAKPKIAAYPFTTLEPNLGVLVVKTKTNREKKLIIADIPGLIEGASEGKGLGIQFLRHIDRTKVLLHLVDVTSEDPLSDFEKVNNELKKYNPRILRKKQIVVLNKIDLTNEAKVGQIAAKFREKGLETVAISALSGTKLENLKKILS